MLTHALTLASVLAVGPVIEVPWTCGETHTCSQSNNNDVSHTGFGQYAWDFGMPVGTDLLAVRGGTVLRIRMDSASGGCSSDYAADANYVVIDHGDGTASSYLHLQANSSNLQVGDPVAEGQVIARSGLTGWTCGPHLHFQTQEICQSWWCQSVPSEFFGAGTPVYLDQVESENCGPCTAALAGGPLTISESQVQCFDRLTQYWWGAGEGLDGHHWYTLATNAPEAETIGRWRFGVDVTGSYEVEVHIPNNNAQATGATYRVHHAGAIDEVLLDQSTQKGWQLLGSFVFNGNGDEFIELPDNTNDGDQPPLAYDSVRFNFVAPGDGDGDPTGDGDGDPGTGDGDGDPGTGDGDGDGECPVGQLGCMCTPGGGCDPGAICFDGICIPEGSDPGGGGGSGDGDSGDGDGDSESGTAGGESGTPTDPGLDYRGDQGCACASAPADPRETAWGGLLLLGLGLVARRRRVGS